MSRPLVGVIANTQIIDNRYPVQACGSRSVESVAEAAGAMPLIFPSLPDVVDVEELLSRVDGVLLTGARPNVHPTEYGAAPHEAYEPYDPSRDAVALPLVRMAVEMGVPLLGVCRGFQEMAVAYGSTLHPEIRDLPGRMNHRMPKDETDMEVIFKPRHTVRLEAGGIFARLFGSEEIFVNSLHGQGLEEPGERVTVEGRAEDTTPEAISIKGAPGFALGVQWHAEYRSIHNEVNRKLFEAFGEALRTYRDAKSGQSPAISLPAAE